MPTTNQSAVINASIEDVWTRFSDFHDLSWTGGVINKVVKVGDVGGGEVGAKRFLNDAFHETLLEMDSEKKIMRYSLDDGPSPLSQEEVSNYQGLVKLSADAGSGGTLVEWSSSWESDSDDAVEFCHNIYVALLKALAKSLE